jgi:hypothetical protein
LRFDGAQTGDAVHATDGVTRLACGTPGPVARARGGGFGGSEF